MTYASSPPTGFRVNALLPAHRRARAPLVLAHVHAVPAKMGPVFGSWDARGTRRSGGRVATLVGTRAVFA